MHSIESVFFNVLEKEKKWCCEDSIINNILEQDVTKNISYKKNSRRISGKQNVIIHFGRWPTQQI